MLATIPPPPVQTFSLGPLTVHVYGILIATGVAVAIPLLRHRYSAMDGDPDVADRVAVWALVAGFVGARGAYVLPRLGTFVDDPVSVVAIWEGGIALYGGLTIGTVAAVVLLGRWGGDLAAFADAAALALPLAQAIGRWGNYFNQELYGTPTTLPWALRVHPAFRVEQYQTFSTFHPTFLYESLGNLVLAAILLAVDRRGRLRRGTLIFLYATGYGMLRFSLELLRVDTSFRFLGLSRNAYVSLAIMTVGAVVQQRRSLLPTGPGGQGRRT